MTDKVYYDWQLDLIAWDYSVPVHKVYVRPDRVEIVDKGCIATPVVYDGTYRGFQQEFKVWFAEVYPESEGCPF